MQKQENEVADQHRDLLIGYIYKIHFALEVGEMNTCITSFIHFLRENNLIKVVEGIMQ